MFNLHFPLPPKAACMSWSSFFVKLPRISLHITSTLSNQSAHGCLNTGWYLNWNYSLTRVPLLDPSLTFGIPRPNNVRNTRLARNSCTKLRVPMCSATVLKATWATYASERIPIFQTGLVKPKLTLIGRTHRNLFKLLLTFDVSLHMKPLSCPSRWPLGVIS